MKLIILTENIELAISNQVDQIANIKICFTEIPEGYSDITSYETLNTMYKYCGMDYILLRDTLKVLYLTDNNIWDTLDSSLQKILVSLYIYPSNYTQQGIDNFYSSTEQEDNWGRLVALYCHARGRRWEKSRQMASFKMAALDSHQLYIDTLPYKSKFIEANDATLLLWLTSSEFNDYGLNFSNNGFFSKPYYSEELLNMLLRILIDGNYIGNW